MSLRSVLEGVAVGVRTFDEAEDALRRSREEFVLSYIDQVDRDHYGWVWAAAFRRGKAALLTDGCFVIGRRAGG